MTPSGGIPASDADGGADAAETISRLVASERSLRAQLEAERASHAADVSRLEDEIDRRGRLLVESEQRARDLRGMMSRRHRFSIRHLAARLRAGRERSQPPGETR